MAPEVSGDAKARDGTPSWDGSAETFQSYCESAMLFEQMTPYHKRYLVGPRLQNELQGSARRLTIGQAANWLSLDGGVQLLLDHLRKSLGRPQVPELTDLLSRYFKHSRRKPGETMGDYITRKCELYVRAQQAMHRLRPHHDVQEPRGQWQGWGNRGRRMSEDSGATSTQTADYEDPQEEENDLTTTPAAPTDGNQPATGTTTSTWADWQWQGWHTNWWMQSDSWSGYGSNGWQWIPGSRSSTTSNNGVRRPLPQLVPEFVQAWMLLQDASLEAQERNTVIIATQGDMSLQRVAQELRNQFPDHDLKKRDSSRRQQSFVGERWEDEDEGDGFQEPEVAFIAEDELNPEGLAMWTEAEGEVQEALAVLNQAKRTLRGARERQRQVKQNRQYFRSSTSSSSRPSGSSDDKITCLRCGATGHRAANCPAPAPKHEKKEMAPFVCYVCEPEETETAWHAEALQVTAPNTTEAMLQGKAVVDCGATKSLGSVRALERIMALSTNGVSDVDVRNKPTFGFGNSSEDTCVSTLHLRLNADGRPGLLRVHALDKGQAPVLLSIDTLKSLKAIIDFEDGSIVFRGVDPTKVKSLEQSSTGHLLLPLTGDILEGAFKTKCPVPGLMEFVTKGIVTNNPEPQTCKAMITACEQSTGSDLFEVVKE